MIHRNENSITFFLNEVKNYDYDLYISLTFLPYRLLKPACLLYNFILELQKIYFTTEEELLAMVKFAWWQDAFQRKNHFEHPLLIEIFSTHELENFNFIALIESYKKLFNEEPDINWQDGNIFSYICKLLGKENHYDLLLNQAYHLTKLSLDLDLSETILQKIDLGTIDKILSPIYILKLLILWQNKSLKQNKRIFRRIGPLEMLKILYTKWFCFNRF